MPYQNKEDGRRHRRERRGRLKVEILTHYGGGKLACVKCGFLDIRALCLDHLNGRGGEERIFGKELCAMLKRKGFPQGYQTLCANCNLIKAIENREFEKGN